MKRYYRENQFDNIIPFVKGEPEWLLLGGPADGNEAQCALKQWPNLKVIAFEPSEAMRKWQLESGWPIRTPIYPYALADKSGFAILQVPADNPRCSSLAPDRPGDQVQVSTITLDSANNLFGPFHKVILWLDIETYEYEALQGAHRLFLFKEILLVNVEILERRREATSKIEDFFDEMGFEWVHQWNIHPGSHHDRIYVPKGTFKKPELMKLGSFLPGEVIDDPSI